MKISGGIISGSQQLNKMVLPSMMTACLIVASFSFSYFTNKSSQVFAAELRVNRHLTKTQVIRLDFAQNAFQPLITTRPDYIIPPVKNGLAPVISRIPTKQPVVFLTIDDGANKQVFEYEMMYHNRLRASLFLADSFIKNNPGFFKNFVVRGSLIENHSVNHVLEDGQSYEQQKQEICGEADLQEKQFGRRPVLYRPPGGFYNFETQRAAADCGMKAIVLWNAKANGGSMQYQEGDSLQPGDIVLMHFRPEFREDMKAFLKAQKAAGLHTELLEDWLPAN